METHTKGPWHWEVNNGDYEIVAKNFIEGGIEGGLSGSVAHLNCTREHKQHTQERIEANAKLIASAPDMLKALKKLADASATTLACESFEEWDSDGRAVAKYNMTAIEEARAVIKRAEGEDRHQDVMNAYADCHMEWEQGAKIRNLDFRDDTKYSVKEASQLMAQAVPGGYNDFDAEVILQLPSNALVQIAREASVCLYVYGATQAQCEKLKPDECSADKDGSIRLWWD